MKTSQTIFTPEDGWQSQGEPIAQADLLIAFGSGKDCIGDVLVDWWKQHYPKAQLVGCSTAGEICDTQVSENSLCVTAIDFDATPLQVANVTFEKTDNSFDIGKRLGEQLSGQDLKLCFVLSDGLHVNGTQLVNGLAEALPPNTLITGGLAGDGSRFQETQVAVNGDFGPLRAVVVGFYGHQIHAGFGSLGGWSTFGPKRLITRADQNMLFELDGQSALALYKDYLGEYADQLPSSGLLFPLRITTPKGQTFVRTLLAIDEETGSMTFAGDIPQGATAELMRCNIDNLVDGAQGAAQHAFERTGRAPELAILISCVGRRLVMNQRTEEEIEAVKDELGDSTTLCGYYSYGEICPIPETQENTLHNQTMTVTTLSENIVS